MDSASKSLMIVHFNETLHGLDTILGYGDQNRFIRIMENHVDENLIYYFPKIAANQWLGLRLELVKKI